MKHSALVYLLRPSETKNNNTANRESGAVIDSLIEPGDLMGVSLP